MKSKYPVIDKVRTGDQIRFLMAVCGLSVADVQEYMGFSTQQAVYHWLNGRSLPSIDNMYALSELFQVRVDDIIRGNRSYQSDKDRRFFRLTLYEKFILGYGGLSGSPVPAKILA